MRRREFLAVAAAAAVPATNVVALDAVIGPSLPARVSLLMPLGMRDGFVELRTYTNPSSDFISGLERVSRNAGASLLRIPGPESTVILRFDSLGQREKFWNAVNADPEWARLREEFESYRFSVYRPARA
jgi:hypothetical protein